MRPRRAHLGLRGRERGSLTLEAALVYPVLLAAIVAVMQGALWYYARSLAAAAAGHAVRIGRAVGAPPGAGTAAAHTFLTRAGGHTLTHTTVTATTTPRELRVQVSGRSLSLIPGTPGLPVHQSAAGPYERWTTP